MVLAFENGNADFTPMISAGGVYVSDVTHRAFVDVDESGTEAAAATAVIVSPDSVAAPEPLPIVVDGAFFFIRDLGTNSVLFVGRESDPTTE
jgi:serpin B